MRKDQDRGPKRREGGFTLIELMVAIAILSFGILAVATMQTTAMRANFRGYRLTEATTLAQDRIEYLTTQPFDDLVVGLDQADPDPANPRSEITYDVEAIPGVTTGWLITVKVQLQGEREREIKFIRIPLKGA
jgi:prepilin-type N-terminal cleavage/methylation domain-containing protein